MIFFFFKYNRILSDIYYEIIKIQTRDSSESQTILYYNIVKINQDN